jgi:hypothetical protein
METAVRVRAQAAAAGQRDGNPDGEGHGREERGGQGQQQAGEQDDGGEVQEERPAGEEAPEAAEGGDAASQALFQGAAAAGDEEIAHVAFAAVGAVALALGGHGDDGLGDIDFGAAAVAGEFFDLGAVAVAGMEVHEGMDAGGVAPEDGLDGAEGLDELLPVDGGEGAHAGDGVAGGDVVGGLILVFALLDALDGLAAVGEFLFEPVEGEAEGRVHAVDVGHQLGDERRGQGGGVAHEIAQDGDELPGVGLDHLQEVVGPDQGGVALAAAPGDALGHEVEVFDEREAQHDGHGPELAERKGMDGLVGADEAGEVFGIDLAVAVADEFHDDIVDAGKAAAGAVPEAGQFAAVAGGQVGAGQFDLLLDEVVVVEQPLAGGRDAVAAPDAFGDDAVAAVDFGGAPGELVEELFRFAQDFDLVVAGEDLGVVFELRDAKQFGAHGHFVGGGALGTPRPIAAGPDPVVPALAGERDASPGTGIGFGRRTFLRVFRHPCHSMLVSGPRQPCAAAEPEFPCNPVAAGGNSDRVQASSQQAAAQPPGCGFRGLR